MPTLAHRLPSGRGAAGRRVDQLRRVGAGERPYYNLALEPCIGAPDQLDDAVLRWKLAQTLAPGEERTWGLEVRLPED
jgi:galactose mutarotase-like enzyme